MTDLAVIRIAVVADTSLQRHILQQFLLKKGYQVVLNSAPQHLDIDALRACQTDLWLYDALCSTDQDCIALEYFLTEPSAPVLFGEGSAPERSSEDYPRWERSLLKKIMCLTPHMDVMQTVNEASSIMSINSGQLPRIELPQRLAKQACLQEPSQKVWLLAASMGGPQAVKAFLDVLPKGLPIGFIYAQHIDPSFEGHLPQAVGRHSAWPVRLFSEYPCVRQGEVVIAPVQHELSFADNGYMQVFETPWSGPYSPSIEQMMCNLAQYYGHHCGVIVFSGMGSDGSVAAEYVQQQGAQVWTQSAESCACSSMPDSVRAAGYSSLSATPEGLAQALVQHVLNQYTQYNDDVERKIS
ncbi:MAG: chemotaxis protein CheB [Pseudomonas sp.]|nr:chemotaxis protein CheB [Pseudomonas sp.]